MSDHRTRTSGAARRTLVCLLVVTALLAACSDDANENRRSSATSKSTTPSSSTASGSSPSATTAPTTTTVPLDAIALRLERVGTYSEPTNLVARPGSDVRYVSEKAGRVRLDDEEHTTALDISASVVNGGERGLLGLAFSPDGTHLVVDYTARGNGETRVEEFTMRADGTADPASRRRLLTIPQPQPNHNGGQVAFGPDGMLYIGMGDGGARDDGGNGHVAGGNAQSPASLLGKILRIDPTPTGDQPYSIPAGNPYANGGGRPEIWAIGLRNPWRFSFDRTTGDLWIGDVGQDHWEEVDFLPAGTGAGANLGWNRYEGTHRYLGTDVTGTVPPIAEYSHGDGCSITGGYVSRGAAVPALAGTYVYSDYCASSLRLLRRAADGTVTERTVHVDELTNAASFGEDAAGTLYVLSQNGAIYRIAAA